ncbi:hypothetical protein [Actinacidiphila sp. ITFR-21]|uniref:hypothetical protein n=1 Tax=Actinacidiphila sp. ITFR-21 TaxID=3075199 RepID=UPI00288A5DEE|nr:hypothetical protein [Streptomyces sp. ITFR-21]WNI20279.1 hypothetical protein RLT57_32960 [Streptomyces sp. ITFR-21]
MSCCDERHCECVVLAGPGATVDGDGSTTAPYVIGATGGGGVPTALAVTDSPTIDLTLTGTGTTADPYDVTAEVILDPAPPGGGDQLLQSGPEGLSLECADVRGCISAEGPATYDPVTGEIGVTLSADAGNTTVLGTDGGIYTPAGVATVLQGGDTNTVDTTATGSGTAGDPYVVEADVIVAPEPNGLEAGPDGLLVAPSADAGNELVIGADGRLFVPAPPPLEIGCGLQGAGTAASPLAALPIAGARLWADDWGCDAAANSTLHCDPDTGALWTPPDHYTAEDHIYVEHFNGGFATPITNTGGWAIINPGASQSFAIPANFQGNQCRTWGFVITASGTWDINHTADAAFQLGYVEVYDGNPATVRPLWGPITALGAARRTRDNGTVTDSGWNIPAASGRTVTLYPAINVTAGSVTINSWVTDATIITTTNTP